MYIMLRHFHILYLSFYNENLTTINDRQKYNRNDTNSLRKKKQI